jgi:hypothetical protein
MKALFAKCITAHVTKGAPIFAFTTYWSICTGGTFKSTVAEEAVEAKLIFTFDAERSAYIWHPPALGLAGKAIELLVLGHL